MIFQIIVYGWLIGAVISFIILTPLWWEDVRREDQPLMALFSLGMTIVMCLLGWPVLLIFAFLSKYY